MTGTPDYSDASCGHKSTARPFVAGSLIGLRTWRLDDDGVLRGITYGQAWTGGENVARCLVTRKADALDDTMRRVLTAYGLNLGGSSIWDFSSDEPTIVADRVPDPCDGIEADCACGFYAYHDPAILQYGGSPEPRVTGIVEAYGRMVVGPKGFRAGKARIVALVKPRFRVSALVVQGSEQVRDCAQAMATSARKDLDRLGWWSPLLRPSAVKALRRSIAYFEATAADAIEQVARLTAEPEALWQRCLARYPDALIYATAAEMRAAHPSADVSHLLAEPDQDCGA